MTKSKKLESLSDLKPDPQNPRDIGEEEFAGLGFSLEEFGDLSGITWNSRTGQLVTGHQRVSALTEKGAILVDQALVLGDESFPIRTVDWPLEKQRAANIAANNYMIAGRFDGTVIPLMQDVRDQFGDHFYTGLRFDVLAERFADEFKPSQGEGDQGDGEGNEQNKTATCPACGLEFKP